MTHMRALHALDGWLAGASHRDIAIALFGAKRVAEAWSSVSELRAQTRYYIRRARDLMEGGYRKLVWPPENRAQPSNLRSAMSLLRRHSP